MTTTDIIVAQLLSGKVVQIQGQGRWELASGPQSGYTLAGLDVQPCEREVAYEDILFVS